MPGWLGAIATWNPLSNTAGAIRELFGNPAWGGMENAIPLALLWPAVLTIIFLPLTQRKWKKSALAGSK
jgi:ABC-2 type transport system permease protein